MTPTALSSQDQFALSANKDTRPLAMDTVSLQTSTAKATTMQVNAQTVSMDTTWAKVGSAQPKKMDVFTITVFAAIASPLSPSIQHQKLVTFQDAVKLTLRVAVNVFLPSVSLMIEPALSPTVFVLVLQVASNAHHNIT